MHWNFLRRPAYYREISNSVAAAGPVPLGDNAAHAIALPRGHTIAGNLTTADMLDWYQISLAADVTHQFDLMGSMSGRGSLNDPWLSLRDANGIEISHNDNGGAGNDARLHIRPHKGGAYFIVAGGRDAGSYQLVASATTKILPAVAEPAVPAAHVPQLQAVPGIATEPVRLSAPLTPVTGLQAGRHRAVENDATLLPTL